MALGALDTMGLASLERWYREVVASLDDAARIVLVGEDGGEIVAMGQLVSSGATNADHRAEVQRVGVASRARGRGIGRQLMQALEDAAREQQLGLLWLTTHDGTEACAFYEAIGYTKLGVMPDYSRRPDGTLWPGAFYFKVLSA
ncbi:MAG: GNAT family N-acetyltransferase [Actinobacteria bacterium]|nr:GNAT family N-acetyltransferase [Actinomycetota bacterium]